MSDEIQSEIHVLLNNFWILKEDNMELYYSIKRHQEEIRSFIVRNLGSRLIIHEKFIKLEKLPTIPSSNLGIKSFLSESDYVYLCIILLFLEDKHSGTYFTLSNLVEFVKSTMVSMEMNTIPDWKTGRDRKSFNRATQYLIQLGAIIVKDESGNDFSNDENANALYISTGISNYVMRVFNNEIFEYTKETDFIKDEWMYQEEEKGDIRKYKIYRNLLFTPVVFSKNISESEIDYLKKLRGHMKDELSNTLGLELEVTRNMALVFDYESNISKDNFPNNKRISMVVLMVNSTLLEMIKNKKIMLDEFEIGNISYNDLYDVIIDIKLNKVSYLSSGLKMLSDENFFLEVTNYMEEYSFIRKLSSGDYEILPSIRIYGSVLLESKNMQLEMFGSE